MNARIILALFVIVGGAMGDLFCPELNDNSTEEETNMIWTCEQINWRNALARWKNLAERDCNISAAEQYWTTVFECPDFSSVKCSNELARSSETDMFNCSIIFCSDGMYTDDTVFLDIWRRSLTTYKTIMKIYQSKLINCSSRCLKSDAIMLEAWNSQNQRYSDLTLLMDQADERINILENNSAKAHNVTILSETLAAAENRINQLEMTSQAQSQENVLTSGALTEAVNKIVQLQNLSQDLTEQAQQIFKLSEALAAAEIQLAKLQNETEAKARSVILLSEALSEAENKIVQLENTSQAQTQKNVVLSEALADAEEKIAQLQNTSQEQVQETYKLSEALAVAESKLAKFQNESQGHCSMRYNGKCFWLEVRMSSPITFEEAAQICESHGATMANIYSEDHHVMMMGYLRMFTDINGKWMFAWLGMTYDAQAKTVLLSTGATAPFVKWGIGNPRNNNCCKMYLQAQTNTISTEQYMYTSSTSYARRGVFCEK